MNIKTNLKRVLAATSAVIVLTAFAGCDKEKEDLTSSVPSQADTESTVSELLPVTATFPEEYTLMTSTVDGENIDIKGNTALHVEPESSRIYDPYSFEGQELAYSFKTAKDVGCGSNCNQFLDSYGIKRGYYSAFDGEGNAVDITEKSDNSFTVLAMLSFTEQDGSITYMPGGKLNEHYEGIFQGGYSYIQTANIGTDLLFITLSVNGDLTVESFDIAHYIV